MIPRAFPAGSCSSGQFPGLTFFLLSRGNILLLRANSLNVFRVRRRAGVAFVNILNMRRVLAYRLSFEMLMDEEQ